MDCWNCRCVITGTSRPPPPPQPTLEKFHPASRTIREPTLELLGAARDRCNKDLLSLSTGLWGPRVRGSLSRRRRLQTDKSSGQQLPRERRPSSDSSRCACRPLAASWLHQPSPPQLSRPDWLLSSRSHDKRDSHGGSVVVWLLLCDVVVVVVVFDACVHRVHVHNM